MTLLRGSLSAGITAALLATSIALGGTAAADDSNKNALVAALDASEAQFDGALTFDWQDANTGKSGQGGYTTTQAWQYERGELVFAYDTTRPMAAVRASAAIETLPQRYRQSAHAVLKHDSVELDDWVPVPQDVINLESVNLTGDPLDTVRSALYGAEAISVTSSGPETTYQLRVVGSKPERTLTVTFENDVLRTVLDPQGISSQVTAYASTVAAVDLSTVEPVDTDLYEQILTVLLSQWSLESYTAVAVRTLANNLMIADKKATLGKVRTFLRRNLNVPDVRVKKLKRSVRVCGAKDQNAPAFPGPCVLVKINKKGIPYLVSE